MKFDDIRTGKLTIFKEKLDFFNKRFLNTSGLMFENILFLYHMQRTTSAATIWSSKRNNCLPARVLWRTGRHNVLQHDGHLCR